MPLNAIPSISGKCISYPYYFMNLGDANADNINGSCSIVSTQMLLDYYDTFENDNLVDKDFDYLKTGIFNNCCDYDITTLPDYIEDAQRQCNLLHDYLVDICTAQLNFNPTDGGGTSGEQQYKLINAYMNTRGLAYKLNSAYRISDVISGYPKKLIIDAIDAGRPIIVNSKNHSTVAYGYDDTFVYIHDGYNNETRVTWDFYEFGISNSVSVFDLELTGSHIHSNNYYSRNLNQYLCPCDELFICTMGDFKIDFSVKNTHKIRIYAIYNVFVDIYTISDQDTSFYNVTSSNNDITYDYLDDTEGISDEYYNYNANLTIWDLKKGESVSFMIDGNNEVCIYLHVSMMTKS